MDNNPIETLSGHGEVWDGNNKVAAVSYNLKVKREVMMPEPNWSEMLEGYAFISGNIRVLDGGEYLFKLEKPTLKIQDGRKVYFLIRSGEPMKSSYQIQPTGNFYV
ncbi:hypothetical protein ACFLXC_04265 [Chloroflexota bacterium]